MEDYDAGFMDAVKLMQGKLELIIKEHEGSDVELLRKVRQKLFKE